AAQVCLRLPVRAEGLALARFPGDLALPEEVGEGPGPARLGGFERLFGSSRVHEQGGQVLEDLLPMVHERDLARVAGHVGAKIVDGARARATVASQRCSA